MSKVRKRRTGPNGFRVTLAECNTCGYAHNTPLCPKCGEASGRAAPRKRPTQFEAKHQAALFDWAGKAKSKYPDLGKLYHVPNGGARNPFEGARLKAEGVRAGQLDINLDVARGGFFGLRIELKATKAELGETPAPNGKQAKVIAELRADGYYAVCCQGWDHARAVLTWYVRQPKTVATPHHGPEFDFDTLPADVAVEESAGACALA
jgi:ribosomal protein L32